MPMERVRPGADMYQTPVVRDRADRLASAGVQGSFREQLAQVKSGKLSERIDKSLREIEDLGNRLGESLTMVDLKRYKQAISSLFRDLTSNMVQIRTDMEWDSQAWEHRTLVTIRKVDAELERLTEMVLDQEQDRMRILEKLGEIKGMLLDVRM